MTQRELMLAGELYRCTDEELTLMRKRARERFEAYNAESDGEARRGLLNGMLGAVGTRCWIEPPFMFDYGVHIELGDSVFMNYNCVILDCALVRIGDATKFGPGVQLYSACHPVDPIARRNGDEFAKPITIGENVWIGGGTVVCADVIIGDNSVIGAGSVVTRSIPPNVVAVGNPCRVIRQL